MIIFPFIVLFFLHFSLYDGIRHLLWTLPYFCIIPGLTIYYLIENFNLLKSKLTLISLSLFIIYFLFNFFLITPYQYTYLNLFNGKVENRYKKFENDYWATSISELLKNANFKTDEVIKISTCGISDGIPKQYFKKRSDFNYEFVSPNEADYIIMINRVMRYNGTTNCFDEFLGDDIAAVKRNGLILSVIRKIKT